MKKKINPRVLAALELTEESCDSQCKSSRNQVNTISTHGAVMIQAALYFKTKFSFYFI